MDPAVCVYKWTAGFPDYERYGMISQMRRSAASVPNNIAEGWGKGTTRLFLRPLRDARGSLAELETQIELAARVLDRQASVEILDLRARSAQLVQALMNSPEAKLQEDEGERGGRDA